MADAPFLARPPHQIENLYCRERLRLRGWIDLRDHEQRPKQGERCRRSTAARGERYRL